MREFAQMYARRGAAVLVWSMGITQHACGVGQRPGASSTSALARGNVGRPGAGLMPIRGHSGVQGGAEMGAYATAFPGGVPIDGRVRGARSPAVRLPGPRRAGPHRRRDGRGRRARRARRALLHRRQLPRRRCPTRALVGERARARPAARPPGHRHLDPDARRPPPARRAAAARDDALRAARRRHRDDHRAPRRLQPRDPRPAARRGTRRVADLLDLAAPRRPGARRTSCASPTPRRSARRSRGSCPSTTASSTCARPATRSSGAARACATAGCSRRPTARRTSSAVAPREPTAPGGALPAVARAAASSSTRWSGRTQDPLTGADRDALFIGAEDAAGLGVAEGAPSSCARIPARCGRASRSRRVRPGNVQMFFPEAIRSSRAGRRDPVAFVPDYNAVVEVIPA